MLISFSEGANQLRTFQTYKALSNHIEWEEQQEYLQNPQKAQRWVFARHPYRRMMALHHYLSGRQRKGAPKTKDIAGFDILEMMQGDPNTPTYIPITPNLDIELLRKKWCHSYGKAHGLSLVEITDILDFRKLAKMFDPCLLTWEPADWGDPEGGKA